MSDIMFVDNHPTRKVRFAAEPVYNALCSICLLSQGQLDNMSSWVDATKQHLTDEERQQAKRACHVAPFVEPETGADLPSLLDRLADVDPSEIRAVDATRLRQKATIHLATTDIPAIQDLVSNRDAYVDLLARLCAAQGCEDDFDRTEEEAVFDELHDGTVYRDKLVSGVRHLWEQYLSEEWPRVEPVIETSVKAFESIEIPGGTIEDQLKFITERETIPEEWLATMNEAREVVFIPSVHIGPFMALFEYDGSTAYLVGRARIPEGSAVHAAELNRSDLLIRLDALSDATRLRVLELAGERDTITAQEVIDALELSQSSASRQLTQLTATGLLAVDGTERTKRYRLNAARIDQVFSGLKEMLGPKARA